MIGFIQKSFHMKIIEFIGIPGAGKSTIRKSLVATLKQKDPNSYLTSDEAFLAASRKDTDILYRSILRFLPNKLALKLAGKIFSRTLFQFEAQNRFLAKNGKAFEVFLASNTYHYLPLHEKIAVITAFMQAASLREMFTTFDSTQSLIFCEEGLVQKSFMFLSAITMSVEYEENRIKNYLDHIPPPDVVVHVDASCRQCLERMLTRPEGLTDRLKKIDKKSIDKFLENSANHIQKIISWLNTKKEIEVLHVKNSSSISQAIENLEKKIMLL